MFRKKKSGLTLLELVVAVALLAIILLPLMRSFVTAAKVNSKSRDIMAASNVAEGLMEGISGKTYLAVLKGMDISQGGFDFSKDGRAGSGAYAFSSINNNFYNSGLRAEHLGNIEGLAVNADNKGVDKSGIELDQAVSTKAIEALTTRMQGDAPLDPADEVWNGDKTSADNNISSDKMLYYGFSDDKYADGNPKVAYMMYTRLNKDNHYYDAIITFVPSPQNVNTDSSGTDKYFSYKVRIAMYEFDIDDYEGPDAWPSRFDGSGHLEGSPTAVFETGIQYQ